MTASPDQAIPEADILPTTMDGGLAHEMVNQMADVARAMFSLLLVHAAREPVAEDRPQATYAEPQAQHTPAQGLELPDESLDLSPALMEVAPLAAALPLPDTAPAHVPAAATPSLAMPASIAMPGPDVPVLPTATVPDIAVAAVAPVAPVALVALVAPEAPRSMAMLSEIGFLDD